MLTICLRCSRSVLAVAFVALLAVGVRADTLKVPSEEFPTIQSAVSAASPGDVVAVNKGIYNEEVTIFQPGITLVGKKAIIDAEYAGCCIRVAATDVSISGFVLVNADVAIHGFAFDDGGDSPDNLSVTKCAIRSSRIGIQVDAASPRIVKNTIQDCVLGISLSAGGDGTTVVSRNSVLRCSNVGIDVEAPAVELERNTLRQGFTGMVIRTFTIFADGEKEQLPSTIVDNRVEGQLDVALQIDNGDDQETLIEGNRLNGNGRGLEVVGNNYRILDNEASRNAEIGMLLGTAADGHLVQSLVRGNVCKNNGFEGIRIDGPVACRGIPETPNRFRDNECQGNGRDGMAVHHAHSDELIDNTCSKNGGDGIDIEFGFTTLLLEGNKCTKNEHEGIDNSGNATLRDNTAKGNARGTGPDFAGAGDDGGGNSFDGGGNKFGSGGFDVSSRLDIDDVLN